MSESKYTPGPWFGSVGQFSETMRDQLLIRGGDVHGAFVAHVHPRNGDNKMPDSEARANARLIAAAPAMDLVLRMLAVGVARIERTGTLIEFCFDGLRYCARVQSSPHCWVDVLECIGWEKCYAAIEVATELAKLAKEMPS